MARLLVLCGILGASGVAAAQAPRYPRPQPAPIAVSLSARVQPIQPKPADPAPQRPALDVDAVLSIESLVRPSRDDEHEQILTELISATPDSEVDEKSDYYFRLAEVYARQQRTWRLKSAELATRAPKDAEIAAQKAKMYLLKAVKTYKGLTENDAFRNYPKLDVALFYYAYTLQSGKYMKEARSVYDKLLKNFPNSKYVPEAHLAFAEYYFEQAQYPDAEARYKVVLKFPASPGYAYALYKLGWIDLQLQHHEDALQVFVTAIQATRGDATKAALNRAAKDGFVEAYAQIGKPERAASMFARLAGDQAFDLLQTLADRELETGKAEAAIYLYQELIKTAPTNQSVCRWQYNVAHAMLSVTTASPADRVREIEHLVKLYAVLRPGKALPPAEAQECHDNAAAMSGELARAYHAESVQTKNPQTFAYAERLYKAYAEGFPDEAAPASYADLLWSRAEGEVNVRLQPDRWAAAAEAFLAVATSTADPQRRSEAATLGVLAWKNALDIDPRPSAQAGTIDLEAAARAKPRTLPVPPREERLLAAFETYAGYLTDRDEIARTKFLEATLYRRHGQYEKAIPLLTELLAQHRDHETAELAANLLLESMIRLQRLDEVLALVDTFAADPRFLDGKPALRANIKLLRSRSLRRR